MILPCPFCGPRDAAEFIYRGDASLTRPSVDAGEAAWADYVYLRDNPAGPFAEHWYHAQGCRTWIVVNRDTRNHAIAGARLAKDTAR